MALTDDFKPAADDRVGNIMTRLSKVPEGAAVVKFLKDNAVKIELYDDPYNWAASTATITAIKDGVYSYKDPMIILKKGLTDDNLVQAIVHETGHLMQHYAGVGNPDRILSTEQYILFYRAAEAHAQALTTAVAWAMKETGDTGPWEAAKFVGYGDITDAYEKAVTEDPAALKNGHALRVAFDAWFGKPERLAGYNAATVDNMIPFLEKGRKEIFKESGLVEKALDATWPQKLDGCDCGKYLHLEGFKDLLTDPWYARDTDTRPPRKTPANTNDAKTDAAKPPAPPAVAA